MMTLAQVVDSWAWRNDSCSRRLNGTRWVPGILHDGDPWACRARRGDADLTKCDVHEPQR